MKFFRTIIIQCRQSAMTFTLFLIALTLLAIIYLLSTTKYFDYWKNQGVPHEPNPIPIFGHILPLFLLRDNFGTLLEKFYRKMGKSSMRGCYVMRRPGLLIRDPELIKKVVQTNFSNFQNNLVELHEKLDPILSKNPFFAKDETWEKSRVLLTSNFSGRKLRCLLIFVDQACEKLKLYIDSKIINNSASEDLELRFLFSRAIADIIANVSFGLEGRNFEDEIDETAFINIPEKVFNLDKFRAVQQLTRFFLPKMANLMRVGVATEEVNGYIKHHMRNFIESKLQSGSTNSDYLQFSMNDVNKIDENMIMAQATAILFDGYEAIGSTLSFLFYRLSQNLEIQEKAREEVNRVFEEFNLKFSYESLKNMTYMDQIINEVLRMNPLFGDITRLCNEETTLEGFDGLTCRLRPGDMVLVSATGLHYDQEFWPDPDTFDPERFDPSVKRNKYTYFGFSQGARMCPGRRMGVMVVKAVAAMILHNYLTVTSNKMEVKLTLNKNTFASSVEGGVWVNFKPFSVNS